MIKSQKWEVSDQLLDETLMIALESQFKATALCLNKTDYELHKRTEILLGDVYKRISQRGACKIMTEKSTLSDQ